jgi:succinoglycan biosynthesis transport protein ExoP
MTYLPSRWDATVPVSSKPRLPDPAPYFAGSSGRQSAGYWSIIRSNLGLIGVLAFAGLLLGWLAMTVQRPLYRAKTELDIRSLNENFLNTRDGASTGTTQSVLPESYIQTEIKILQSDSIRQRALRKITSLQEMPKPASEGGLWQAVLDWLKPRISAKNLVADASRRVKVRAVGNTRIVELFCEAWDGQIAADMCNTVARTYIENNLESRSASSKETSEWLQSQLDDVRKRLTSAENDLKDAGKDAALGLASSVELNPAEEKLHQMQGELSRIQAERIARESTYMIASNRSVDSLPSDLDSGPIRDYRLRLAEARRQLSEATATMTPEHYRVKELNMEVENLDAALQKERLGLVDRLKSDLESVLNREKMLTGAYAQAAVEVSRRDDKAVRYNMVKREVDSERQLYGTLLQKVGEVGLAAAMRTSTITVVDPAVAPSLPYSPNIPADLGFGFFGGTALGVALALMRFRSDRTLRSPGEAALHLQVREVGVIPSIRGGKRLRGRLSREHLRQIIKVQLGEKSTSGAPFAASAQPERQSIALATWLRVPEMVEAVTSTMNSLIIADKNATDKYAADRHAAADRLSVEKNRSGRVIVLTSPEAGDGKTTVAVNLAVALAQIGRKVVLVDGDLRKPQLHTILGESPEAGLDVLLEEAENTVLQDGSLRETAIPNLRVILTQPVREGISRKLHSPRMRSLLQQLRRDFDVVIIDSPPMQDISDARVLGWLGDGVLLVFRAGKTTRQAAMAAHDCLTQDGIQVLGTILNDWNARSGDRFSAYSSYFHVA